MGITEGEGDTDKGMKWEWSTVKNGYLYIGSMGKEYTNPDGSVANTNNLWISIINSRGEVIRKDWTDKYNFVRAKLGAAAPGYTINEAIMWSDYLKKWIFIPRRISSEKYDEVLDEKMGSNKLVLVDDSFTSAQVVDIKFANVDPCMDFLHLHSFRELRIGMYLPYVQLRRIAWAVKKIDANKEHTFVSLMLLLVMF